MKSRNNGGNLKAKLEDSSNVVNVELKGRIEEKPKYYLRILKVEFKPKGYAFERLHQQYPTMRVTDIEENKQGNIEAVIKVNEVEP